MDASMSRGSEKEQHTSQRSRRQDILLLSHPRTASNLLTRLLSTQPGWIQKDYPFRSSFTFSRTSCNWNETPEITDEDCQQFESLFQRGFTQLCRDRDTAIAEGNSLMVKTHTIHLWEPSKLRRGGSGGLAADSGGSSIAPTGTNPTLLPDSFLASWQPVFLIRHPALVFESWYRAEVQVAPINIVDAVWSCFMTFRYSRQLYDWFVSNDEQLLGVAQSPGPIVIDADDIIEGESTISKLCDLCNMDSHSICREWEARKPPSNEALSPRHLIFMRGLWESTSIDKSKTSQGLDIAMRHAQWKDEFGATVADVLLSKVEDSMPDYEYLRNKKI